MKLTSKIWFVFYMSVQVVGWTLLLSLLCVYFYVSLRGLEHYSVDLEIALVLAMIILFLVLHTMDCFHTRGEPKKSLSEKLFGPLFGFIPPEADIKNKTREQILAMKRVPDERYHQEFGESLLNSKLFNSMYVIVILFALLFQFVIDPSAYPAWWRGYIDLVYRLMTGMQGTMTMFHDREGIAATYAVGTIAFVCCCLYIIKHTLVDKKGLCNKGLRQLGEFPFPLKFYVFGTAIICLIIDAFIFNSATEPGLMRSSNAFFSVLTIIIWMITPFVTYILLHSLVCDIKLLVIKIRRWAIKQEQE